MSEKISRFCGYPINSEKFRDKDAIVTFLTPETKLTLKVNGGYLPGGKYHQAAMLFNKVTVEVGESLNGYLSVRGATTLENNVMIYEDLPRATLLNFEREILLKMFTEDDVPPFAYFERSVALMKDGFDVMTAALVFLAAALAAIGMRPKTDGCNRCDKTANLVHFSMAEGGFLCNTCARENGVPFMAPLYLKTMKYAFRVPPEKFGEIVLGPDPVRHCLTDLLAFVDSEFGLSLKTADFLLDSSLN